ncbi:MAG: hypothetical protein R2725_12465 [Solirubrobacterales bacterium]
MAGTSTEGLRGRRPLAALLAAAVAALVAATAVALSGGSGPRGDSAGAHPAAASAQSSISSDQLIAFPVLGEPGESLPGQLRQLGRPLPGMRWGRARRLPVDLDGVAWVVPGTRFICLVVLSAGTGTRFCAPTAQAVREGIAGVFIRVPEAPWIGDSEQRVIVGLAPSGSQRMRIYTNGRATTAPVRADGVFVLRDGLHDPPERSVPE